MPVQPGANLGPYQIVSLLGAGGMGEVYRARDTRLDRIVAIKVLPAHLSNHPDLVLRLEREARAVSSLNHPNICALYDIGKENGTSFLVMEYIEGETLAVRLQNGPLSQSELLRFAIQIADALDKAHKQGIVHRDLKPGNIILSKAGAKLLDFGLAKVEAPTKSVDVSSLATEHRELTQEGTVLGTFQYMAPEQLEGREADARTDIFAFGAVLYEMATGKKAFEGKSQASLIAAILKEEPQPISQLQPLAPPLLERLIHICLAKDPDDRWQSAHDIGNQLRWIAESSGSQFATTTPAVVRKSRTRMKLLYGLIAVSALIAAASVGLLASKWKPELQIGIQTQFTIMPPPGASVVVLGNQADIDFSISPDGMRLVYPVTESSTNRLYLRNFASGMATLLPGTEGARFPFWSPDGQQIAFVAQIEASESQRQARGTFTLKRIPFSGGSARTICVFSGEFRGGAWLPDGTIVFGLGSSGLQQVSVDGGDPKTITELNAANKETSHSFPFFLPDYKHYLYLSDRMEPHDRWICLGSLDSKKKTCLVKSPFAGKFLEPGFLLFMQSDSLVTQALQLDPPRLIGETSRIADQIPVNVIRGAAPFNASSNRVIAYRTAGIPYKTQLAWFDRGGKRLEMIGQPIFDVSVDVAPDQRRAVTSSMSEIARSVGRAEIPVNLWVIDLVRGIRTRVTFDATTSDENPIWSPDQRSLIFASHVRGGQAMVLRKSSSGEGQTETVFSGKANEHPIDWSPDGKVIIMQAIGNASSLDLLVLPLAGDGKPFPFVSTPADDGQAQFSPDGRFVAYTSGESGRLQVYVKRFPSGEGKWQVSSDGGAEPRWRQDGKELFYIGLDGALMAVKMDFESGLDVSPPERLFEANLPVIDMNYYGGAARYDVARDGTRFLMQTLAVPDVPPALNVITNWSPPARRNADH